MKVLVRKDVVTEAATQITRFEYIEVSVAQALAYSNGDPNWRNAKDVAWYSRLWRRLSARRTPN